MTIRPARLTDFAHLETFVWQAIFPALDIPGLNDAQRAENDALVAASRPEVTAALQADYTTVLVAEDHQGHLAGYVIADARPKAYAEITALIVKRRYWGKGVGAALLEAASQFIGSDRAVALVVRHYNRRALAFFAKHGFVDTGETTGEHAIPRTLMLREATGPARSAAAAKAPSPSAETTVKRPYSIEDFPSEADAPLFEPLPDYRLATDETPLFETGSNALRTDEPASEEPTESSLSDEQLSVLEAFIAKARARKAQGDAASSLDAPSRPVEPPAPTAAAARKIPFEIDFGDRETPFEAAASVPDQPAPKVARASFRPSFSFDFAASVAAQRSDVPAGVRNPSSAEATAPPGGESPTKVACTDCGTALPVAARFCYVCGMPQIGTPHEVSPEEPSATEVLELPELPDESAGRDEENAADAATREVAEEAPAEAATGTQESSVGELRKIFRQFLENRVRALFGAAAASHYLRFASEDNTFGLVRDGSLYKLADWLNDCSDGDLARMRRENTFADLTEYFIVATAGHLSGNVLPQRLLRHQSVNWQTADLFRLVMDYLDFDSEQETVYTDFVTMPERALKNATRIFLHTSRDERVFFVCDQSLISQAKNGFAITDAGIYWKNVLQPPGAATFTTMPPPAFEDGHLVIDGQFFDAGARLNLKVAVLLDKLRRMR